MFEIFLLWNTKKKNKWNPGVLGRSPDELFPISLNSLL